MSAPLLVDPIPLATVDDMTESPYAYLVKGGRSAYLERTMMRASRNIEARTTRRLMPFAGLVQTELAEGVSPDDAPGGFSGPQSMGTTLAVSRARALNGGGGMVRHFRLDHFAPLQTELWTYSGVSVSISTPTGSAGGPYTAGAGGLASPAPDTGQLVLPLGTYCPVGSLVTITYSGGYTVAIPDDLNQAAMMAAAKLLILGIAPERRGDLNTVDLDNAIGELLIPWAR